LLKKIIILKKVSHILVVSLFWAICLFSLNLLAQTTPKDSLPYIPKDSASKTLPIKSFAAEESNAIQSDSSLLPSKVRDSISQKSNAFKPDTKGMDSLQLPPAEKGDIATTIYYHAEDSIMMDVATKKAYLYGKAQIKYQDMQLDAEQIEIRWDKNIISAKGKVDTTGKYKGWPVWKQGKDTYVTDSMTYNMKSSKGIIHGIQTKQGDGYLQGDTAKRTQEAIFMKNGIYTTCNLKHPHFYIKARKLKVYPESKALSGPFNIVLEDIPTPIGFWLGFFPITDKKKSGIVFPAFGSNQNRGLYISKGGYYWAINDRIGLEIVGDAYANGSWLLNGTSTYIKRYKYRGTMSLSGSKIKNDFNPYTSAPKQFSVIWTHSNLSKRTGSFTANVNLSSSKFTKQNVYTTARTQNTTTSSITYSKQLGRSPFSLSVSMRANQNNVNSTATNNQSAIYNVTLPSASLNMNRISLLKKKHSDGRKWYEKIFLSYQSNFNYNLTNQLPIKYDTTQRAFVDSVLQVNNNTLRKYIIPNSVWTSGHTASLSSSFNLFRFLVFTPSVNYFDNMHGKKYGYTYGPSPLTPGSNVVTTSDTSRGFFNSFYANTSVNLSTRMYGTWQIKGNGSIKGIRHTFNPTIGLVYAPDFSKWQQLGGYQQVKGDLNPKGETAKYYQFNDNLSQTPIGQQAVLNFTLNNIVEAKIKNNQDTSGTKKYKKMNLLDNFGIAGGYNFAADSLKMRNITMNARTNLFSRFNISLSSTFDPYLHVADSIKIINGVRTVYNDRQVNQYLFKSSNYTQLAQLSNFIASVSTTFKSAKRGNQAPLKATSPQMQAELDYIKANPNQYIDFNVPWSLILGFNYSYTHSGQKNPTSIAAFTASGNISLTPKWKIVYTSGFDVVHKAFTVSNFTFSRDLHCWQMNMTLSPFGSYKTFLFTIAAKSQLLQTLKLNKRSPSYIQ
jgi:hypothetical protein